ncbi:GxxExxY protein [Labilibaculum antarcticum]|uniref:GxxExxY protein n=1 Tax=Labilibaculum antarcticum TaxID=1717717 RepID=A0A1Y1CQV3_9BACT|nr:GxxExxY protein [Labilibaculum antarcticum]BAX82644.1 hypothetical protein ALGA_4354 [Labilibaculum antarcticum]
MDKIACCTDFNQLIEIGQYIYKQLGNGLAGHVYQDVFELELELRNVKYFSDEVIENTGAIENLLCIDDIAVGIKSNSLLTENQEEEFVNNLNKEDYSKGLLFNFGSQNLQLFKVGEHSFSEKYRLQ